jgi:A/G-specific adenine glycosylase
VMLQQTQVIKVIPYYENFLQHFPTLPILAKASLQQVLKCWEGLGYYSRARHLHQAVQVVIAEHNGSVPNDFASFRKLPGVGDYIAAAVLSQVYDTPLAVVDGNVKRVITRLFTIDAPINDSLTLKQIQEQATELLDANQPGQFNQAMMELGATICLPKKLTCNDCPVNSFCLAQQHSRQHELPVTTPKKTTPEYRIAVGIVYKRDKVLLIQRPTEGLLGGMWEFPGGRITNGLNAKQTCIDKIKAKTNLTVSVTEYLTEIRHVYSHFRIVMTVFICQYQSGEIRLKGPIDSQWIHVDELDQFPIPAAHHKFIPMLRELKDSPQRRKVTQKRIKIAS